VDNIRNPNREITIAMCGKYTKLEDSYASIIESFHHCSAHHEALQEKGMVFSGMSPNGKLVEFIELPELKFFCATQAHPELKSHMETPSPLFFGFVKACMDA